MKRQNKKRFVKTASVMMTATVLFLSNGTVAFAANDKVTSVLPCAGASVVMASEQVSLSSLQEKENLKEVDVADLASTTPVTTEVKTIEDAPVPLASSMGDAILKDIVSETGSRTLSEVAVEMGMSNEEQEAALFRTLVIADVNSNSYVNVRSGPGEDYDIVGKLYDNSVGSFLEEENGWYKIQSGSVTGYVKAEFCVTGEEAVELAPKVGTRIATVTTTTLKVRKEASLDAEVLGLVPIDEQLVVREELDGWVKVDIEEGEGYVSSDYVRLHTEFVKAESKEEEEARLAKERAAREAANAAAKKGTKSSSSAGIKSASSYTTETSSIGQAVANFACQFVGNPYVYGGSSLTNGTDCSGFVMSVYANFGVSLPHSSTADRSQGAAVDGLANAQPGDIVCYSGHVGIYIGNGQIVHASTSKTGIIISNAGYRAPLAVRRIF